MKKMILLILLLAIAPWMMAQEKDDLLDPVIKTIREADAKGLAAFFNMTVEMRLPDHEDTYSASQGEMIMKDFFKKYPPDSLSTIQTGTIDANSRFAICGYLSHNIQYQVYIYMKKEKDRFLVHMIKFEETK